MTIYEWEGASERVEIGEIFYNIDFMETVNFAVDTFHVKSDIYLLWYGRSEIECSEIKVETALYKLESAAEWFNIYVEDWRKGYSLVGAIM